MPESTNINVLVRLKPRSTIDEDDDIVFMNENSIVLTPPDIADVSTPPSMAPHTPHTPRTPRTPRAPQTPGRQVPYTPAVSGGRTPAKHVPKTFTFDRCVWRRDQSGRGVRTGAGKTYTMMGDSSNLGYVLSVVVADPIRVIPRAVCKLFDAMTNETDANKLFHVRMTYVELYNDRFRDLLSPQNDPALQKAKLPCHVEEKIVIKERNKSIVLVGSDTLQTPVTSCAEALLLINKGNRARAVGATNLNAHSSRSHAILIFHVESRLKSDQSLVAVSKLHLVDLAGSERLDQSGSEGTRMLEAQHINGSLTALADVLAALSKKREGAAVPYRNSKLTRLLQDSLGGTAKTLMITNILGAAANYKETLSSLKWAARARAIVNAVKQNLDEDGDSKLRQLQNEVTGAEGNAPCVQRSVVFILLQRQLAARAEEFEKLQAMAANEHSEELQAKLQVIARVNRREKASLERTLQEVIYSRNGDMAEQQYAYAQLQEKIDSYKTAIHELRVNALLSSDEIASLNTRVCELESNLTDVCEDRDRLTSELRQTQNRLHAAEQLAEQRMNEMMGLEKHLESAQQQQQKQQMDAEEERMSHLQAENKQLEAQLAKTQARMEKMKAAQAASQETADTLQSRLNKAVKKEQDDAAVIQQLRAELARYTSQSEIVAAPAPTARKQAKHSAELQPLASISPIARVDPEPAPQLDISLTVPKKTTRKEKTEVAAVAKRSKPFNVALPDKENTDALPKEKRPAKRAREPLTAQPVAHKPPAPAPSAAAEPLVPIAQQILGAVPPAKRRLFNASKVVPLSPNSPTVSLFSSFIVPKLKKVM